MKRVTVIPNTIFLNITEKCQLHCVYCSASLDPAKGSHMDTQRMFALVDECLSMHAFRVITTGGEPLLHPEFTKLIEKLSGRVAVCVLTNGARLDRQMARFFRKWRVNSVGVSLDTPVPEIAERTRGPKSFDWAVQAIRHLAAEGVTVHVNAVLTRHNMSHVPGMIKLCSKIGANSLNYSSLRRIGAALKSFHDMALSLTQEKVFYELFQSAKILAKEMRLGISWTDEYWGNLCTSSPITDAGNEPEFLLPCSAGLDQCAITVNGDMLPCNYFDGYVCGNVFKDGLAKVWHGSRKLALLRKLPSTPLSAIRECSACPYIHECNGGCRASAFSKFCDLRTPDPSCWRLKGVAVDNLKRNMKRGTGLNKQLIVAHKT